MLVDAIKYGHDASAEVLESLTLKSVVVAIGRVSTDMECVMRD